MEVIREQSADTSIREFWEAIKRERWVIIITLLVFAGLGAASIFLVEPTYQASTRVVVEGRTANQPNVNNPQDPLNKIVAPISTDINTQLETIQSAKVVGDALTAVVSEFPSLTPKNPGDPSVTARQIGLTNVIEISVVSSNPRLAQRLAAEIPTTYRVLVKLQNSSEIVSALSFLDSTVRDSEGRLRKVESDFQAFLKLNEVTSAPTEGADRTAVAQRAEQEYNTARAELNSELEQLNSLKSARSRLPQTIPNEVVEKNVGQQELARQKLNDLITERDRILQEFDEQSIEFKRVAAQIRAQYEYIRRLPKVVDNERVIRNPSLQSYDDRIADTESRAKAAEARVASRKEFYEEAKARADKYFALSDQISDFRRKITLASEEVARNTAQLQTLKVFENSIKEPVTIIAESRDARRNKPNPPLYMALALIAGSVVALAIAVVKYRLEDRLTTIDQAFRIANVPTLGYVPPRAFGKSAKKKATALPTRVLENYRIVRSNVLFSIANQNVRSIMITSTGVGEGKSEVAANLGIAMAGAGRRVLVVDANIYRPAQHVRFGKMLSPGLSEILAGDAGLASCLHPTEIENLTVLTSGEAKISLADGMVAGKMQDLYRQISEQFDLVIFDTPAMLPRSDALSLSATVDTVVYVVKPGTTTKTLMRYCIELLRHAHARLLGVVFTNTEFYSEEVG
ncbi:MAG: polysaccharide biosynthesis tyrosine autokinase [Fimbriimonadaceae bacterium]|nr:polysaccharide biosynthesis tyrosine autokinase [Fimbriimonadaceae bacterium]